MYGHYYEYEAAQLLINGWNSEFRKALLLCEQGVFSNFDQTFEHEMHGLNFITMAAEHGNSDVIRELVNIGVEVDMTSMYGQTPLMVALSMGQLDAADTLLQLGADWRKRDIDGRSIAEFMAVGANFNPNMDSWIRIHRWD